MRRLYLSLMFILLSVSLTLAQTDTCPDLVQLALETVETHCADIGRNQACYGYTSVDATPQPDADNFQFNTIGDITDVAAIQSLRLRGYDPVADIWGVAMLRVQANIPDSLPGQNITLLLFGDAEIRNAAESVAEQVPPEFEQRISASSDVNVRAYPTTSAEIVGVASVGSTVIATGRTADNQWLRVNFENQNAWIYASLLSSDDPLEALLVVEPDAHYYAPMQAFYLTSGIGRPQCENVPQDGLLVQTPDGVDSVELVVNDAEVTLGSTVYFRVNDNRQLSITPVEGAARVTAAGVTRTAVEGTQIHIPLSEELLAIDIPSLPESYAGYEYLDDLPIEALEREIEVNLGLVEEELERYLEYGELFDDIEIQDVDDVLDYLDSADVDDLDLVGYLVEDLGYEDFGDDLEAYFEDELGYVLDDYESYLGDDFMDDIDNFSDDLNDLADDVDDLVDDYSDYADDYTDDVDDFTDDYGDYSDDVDDFTDDYYDPDADYGDDG